MQSGVQKRRAIVLAAVVVGVLGISGCSLFGWGRSVSVALAEHDTAVTASMRESRSLLPSTYAYNTTQIGAANVSTVQTAYDSTGTYLGSFTPDVFKISGLQIAFARSNSDVGFALFEPGLFQDESQVMFDLMEPVFASERIRWEPGTYDLIQLYVPFDVHEDELVDGIAESNDIQVTIPGYTDAEIFAYQSEVSASHAHLFGTPDDIVLIPYLGGNRFQLPRLYSTARVFVTDYVDEFGGTMSVMFPEETMYFRTGITESTVYSDMAGSVTEASLFDGNTTLIDAGHGTWTDIPFDGFTIDEGSTELFVTFEVDLTGIFELWEMSDEYLSNGGGGLSARYRIRLAPNFYDRITVTVDQR